MLGSALLSFLMIHICFVALDIFFFNMVSKFRLSTKNIPKGFCQLTQTTSALLKKILGWDDLFSFLETEFGLKIQKLYS